MILAAGLGTRLRPLTYETPKALVDVGGRPMLDHVARRVVAAGADRIVVNVSPHADAIRAHIERQEGWGADVRVSEEPDGPLETGGGLRKAAPLFRRDRPILIHNADILTDLDLAALYGAHGRDVLATLAVRPAESDRYLLFDDGGLLGYAYDGQEHTAREAEGAVRTRDFTGVQVVSPRLLDRMEETGKFSIFTPFMRLVAEGERIAPYDTNGARWSDIGTHEQLAAAREAWA
ncbi:MAG: NTP transferase domain-containing protein [Gemmatimonadetes bacterium]|nr:nucleotidyltransferase family protein [Gemmatimonadota bacterium]NIQ57104.1 nucleotidyltransferase family protein [Gemmatimonadota bacterium]NIU77271.1 NTP transferase domain-containing protein [Gammaproteobacteria bacterium]NIX46545.1 NTP transferase domain-containing protein [Gemmatimonadota bacterium]